MGMVLVTAEMLKNSYVRQTGETTGTNYNEAISALKQVIPNLSKIAEQRKKILQLLKWMNQGTVRYWIGASKEEVDNTTTPVFDGKKSVYDAFKSSSHSNGIDVSEYKYMFCKALESKLMVEEMIGYNRKRCYNFSEIVEVTKKARMDNELG
eukprot:12437389-Ditylum_brightwellii.AAC.1